MEGPKILAPVLRRRLLDIDESERVSLRQLVAEYGKHVHPAMAHRAYEHGAGQNKGLFEAVELTDEQKISLGRVSCISSALARIGAKSDGTRTSIDRRYYLPPDKRVEKRQVGPTMVQLPTIPIALAHLSRRLILIKANKSRSMTKDDVLSVESLMRLARAAEAAGMVNDLLDQDGRTPRHPSHVTDVVVGATPGKVERPAWLAPRMD